MTGSVSAIGRSGAVLAMSSGLVASMGLPAGAVVREAPDGARTASIPLSPKASGALLEAPVGGYLALPGDLSDTVEVTAPEGAQVQFEHQAFTAVPRTERHAEEQQTTRLAPRASRTEARTTLDSSGDDNSNSSTSDDSGDNSSSSVGGSSVLAIAARYEGVPYVYGGTSPSGFDCSGFVQYVFEHLGIDLPRTADAQMDATRRVSRSNAEPGDLVFILSGGHAFHVGIFAGGNLMWDAPRTGKSVQLRKIWSSNVVFGKVAR